jgi:ABC-type branched-subunit amino acid transport system substrate-binding protein
MGRKWPHSDTTECITRSDGAQNSQIHVFFEVPYSGSFWEAGLPYPGNREFVIAYENEFKRTPALQATNAYAGCQLLMEAARRAGSTESDRLREVLLKLRTKTILGYFAIDQRGFPGRPQGDYRPVAGWQAGGRLAGRVGFRKASVPDPTVEATVILNS